MKFKVVPAPPADLGFVGEAQRAVPLVPGSEDDCCARLLARTDVQARDRAKEWLTFLRALELVAEGERGYHRLRRDPDPAALADAFRERVYGAANLLTLLDDADAPLDADAAFERFVDRVPEWERRRSADWESTWRERVARLLEWAVLLGLVERADGGYVPADGGCPET